MNTIDDGIIRPVRNQGTPQLGPLAIMVATDADFQFLRRNLRLPETRRLYLSTICFDTSDSVAPVLAGPMMGAPYAVMMLETLHAWGVKTIVFFGWCGSIRDRLRCGDILVPDDAVIDEGTSLHYGQQAGTIVRSDTLLTGRLRSTLGQKNIAHCKGRVWTTDGPFRETPTQIQKFQALDAVAVEMELSALVSTARFYAISLSAVLIVSDELFTLQWRPGFKEKRFKQSRISVCELLLDMYRSLNHD